MKSRSLLNGRLAGVFTAGLLLVAASVAVGQDAPFVMSVRGQLRPAEYSSLAAGVAKTIIEVPVRAGSFFQEGQTLLRFDCREEEAQKEIMEARLGVAKIQLDTNSRLDALSNVSKIELEISRGEVAVAVAELKRIDAMLDKCEIRAPFPGTVTEKLVQPFQFAALGDPLLRIVNPQSLEVEAVLPSSALAWIKEGQPFTVRLDETGEVVNAVVDRLVQEVDPVSQTLRIFGRLQGDNKSLLPGMSGNLDFGTR